MTRARKKNEYLQKKNSVEIKHTKKYNAGTKKSPKEGYKGVK